MGCSGQISKTKGQWCLSWDLKDQVETAMWDSAEEIANINTLEKHERIQETAKRQGSWSIVSSVGLGQGEEFEFYSGSKRMLSKGFLSINIFNSVL